MNLINFNLINNCKSLVICPRNGITVRQFAISATTRNLQANPIQVENTQIFKDIFSECISSRSILNAKGTHGFLLKRGYLESTFVLTGFLNVYSRCGTLRDACQLFDEMPARNVVSWNVIISTHTNHGHHGIALDLFGRMLLSGETPSNFTFGSVFRSCAGLNVVQCGAQAHAHVFKHGLQSDLFIGSAAMDMYAKCCRMDLALQVFDKMPCRDVVSWNALITGYSQNGLVKYGMQAFVAMLNSGVRPNQFALSSSLRACALLQDSYFGSQIHTLACKTGFELQIFVASGLVDLYSKCGNMRDARNVFDRMYERDIVAWTAMMVGNAQNGFASETLELFREMQISGIKPNDFPIASVLSGCATLRALCPGRQVHAYLLKVGFDNDIFVTNALLDMYSKSGSIQETHQLFFQMASRDVVSWNVMIVGYTENEQDEKALKLLKEMLMTDLRPDEFTFSSILKGCATLAALQRGQAIHGLILKSDMNNEVIDCSLVDMYGKCGSIVKAEQVFQSLPNKNIVSWNSMMSSYAHHGLESKVNEIFEQMQVFGVRPNETTFVILLFACSHKGFLDNGWFYFKEMKIKFGIEPGMDHYICMVDLLGRSGVLNEAEKFIEAMPLEPIALVWKTLLSACRLHGNIDIAERAAEQFLRLDPEDSSVYSLLANIYSTYNQWHKVAMVRKDMSEKGSRVWMDRDKQGSSFFCCRG